MTGPLQPEIVYTPESQLRHPAKLFREMFHDLYVSRELAWRLFVRNINVRYRQSILGYLWAFLPPILSTMVFLALNKGKIFGALDTGMPYALFVMIGMVVWQAFVDAVRGPVKLVVASRPMLTRVNFPREALVLASVGEVLFDLLIRASLLIPVYVWFEFAPPLTGLLAAVPIAALIMLGTIIGLFVAPLAVLYQDVEHGLTMIFSVWFFLTPVVYTLPDDGIAGTLMRLNPVTPLLVAARELMTAGTIGNPGSTGIVVTACLAVAMLSWLSYRLAMPRLIERIGS